MNYNPYAPPQANPPPPGGPTAYAGGPQPWEIGEVLSAAFEGLKANWVVMVFANLTAVIIAQVAQMLPRLPTLFGVFRANSAVDFMLQGVGMLIGVVIQSFFQVGLIRIFLGVARGQQPQFEELFRGGDRFVPMVIATLILVFGILFGFALLIVPGVILGLGLCLTSYFVVDQGLGPVEALQASWQATTGYKAKLFIFGMVAFVIAFGAVLLCCLPILAVMPMLGLAMTIVYLRITGRGGAPMARPGGPGFGAPGAPPPGYGPQGGGPGYGPPGGGGFGGPGGGGPGFGGPGGGGPGGYGPPGGGYGPPGGGPGGGRPPGY